jgi:hypothetical protein
LLTLALEVAHLLGFSGKGSAHDSIRRRRDLRASLSAWPWLVLPYLDGNLSGWDNPQRVVEEFEIWRRRSNP